VPKLGPKLISKVPPPTEIEIGKKYFLAQKKRYTSFLKKNK